MKIAVTISLVPEARGGPFVFWDDLEATFSSAASLGFDAVEIFPRSTSDIDPEQIEPLIEKHGLQVAAVGSGAGWVVHKLSLTDPYSSGREAARRFVADLIECAARFGAPVIIGSMQGRADPSLPREMRLDWLCEALEELAPQAESHGQPLLLEPLNRYETDLLNTSAEAVALLDSLRTKNVRLLADLFHMNIEEPSIADSFRNAGTRIGHVHFSDSNRWAIGFGHTDVGPAIAALRAVGFQGYLSAEVFPLPDATSAAMATIKAFRHHVRPPMKKRFASLVERAVSSQSLPAAPAPEDQLI